MVASIGYLAFLAGPPLLGFLGDHVGVLHALLAVVALSHPGAAGWCPAVPAHCRRALPPLTPTVGRPS